MGWSKAQPADRENLIRLLKKNEWEQLHFSSSLREKTRFKLTGKGSIYILKSRGDGIKGAILMSSGGALHVCFEPKDLTKTEIEQLRKLIIGKPFFSFIGRSDRINLIEDLYGATLSHEVDYHLYELTRSQVSPVKRKIGDSINFRLALLSDFKELYPLEEAYQKEEVMRNPEQLNERYLKRKFYKQLSEDIIWVAIKDKRIIAKGGTNAVGFEYCQLGGIYTIPEERCRGIGTHLIEHLTAHLNSMGWGSALFVRRDNSAAIALYENCGYEKKGSFRIVYPYGEDEF